MAITGSSEEFGANKPILLMVAALCFFFANTCRSGCDCADRGSQAGRRCGRSATSWSFPLLPGGRSCGAEPGRNREPVSRIETSLLVLPLIYWVVDHYRLYLGSLRRRKSESKLKKAPMERIASLNMRTVRRWRAGNRSQTTTHTHLQQVRTYAWPSRLGWIFRR